MWTNQDPDRWHRLIAEYGSLNALKHLTRQSRGQRFNHLISDFLQTWGIDARVSIRRPTGEVDVVFTAAGTRYILEAKWQTKKVSPAQISDFTAKLFERPPGVRGLFLSMSGFTREALKRAKSSGANLVLLDRGHWEAILTGLTPPEEFLELAADYTSFYGEQYGSLRELISSHRTPEIDFGVPESLKDGIIHTVVKDDLEVALILTVKNTNQSGIASDPTDKRFLYVTTAHGIVRVNLPDRSWETIAPMTYCHGNVRPQQDGSLYFLRWGGVGMLRNGTISAIGGGLVGATNFAASASNDAWVLDNGTMGNHTSITKIGSTVGEETRIDSEISGSTARGALLDESTMLIHGGPGYYLLDLTTKIPQTFFQSKFGMGIIPLTSRLTAAFDGHSLFLVDLPSQESDAVIHLRTHGSVAELTIDRDDTIYAGAYFDSDSPMSYAVTSIKKILS